ncbi:hypothetical protein evm_006557 [Chilo suppressalis]|nr:hypothetical protein evm_006557 [Chilo suppressalis]
MCMIRCVQLRYLTFLMCVVLVISEENDGSHGLLYGNAKLRFVRCGITAGICIKSNACPWVMLLAQHSDDCIAQPDHVCCKVSVERKPANMLKHIF